MELKATGSYQLCSCGPGCLGPLGFHPQVKGRLMAVTANGQRASRDPQSFHYGLVFSSRPVRLGERISLRIERSVQDWHGAIRVGFTCVKPGSVPMPSLAIPDLTDFHGNWATPVPEQHCLPRTKLTFWVTRSGYLHVQTDSGYKQELPLSQMETDKPLWALIDVYGQTSSVLLLGSKKKSLFHTRHSCHAPTINASKENYGYDHILSYPPERLHRKSLKTFVNMSTTNRDDEEHCVVCFSEAPLKHLSCGHSCLCANCTVRVITEFGTCPLCRQDIYPQS